MIRSRSIEDKQKRALAKKERQIRAARKTVPAFIEYAMRHEKHNTVLRNAEHHLEWQAFLDNNRLGVILAPIEHAKTQQIAIGRLLFAIGTDPGLRCAVISNTMRQAEKIVMAIRQQIETNPRVREVFPHLKPSKAPGASWHNSALTVERPTISKDPTIQAASIGTKILGSRLDILLVDDVLDRENTRTKERRDELLDWFDVEPYSRLTDEGRAWVIGTPFHHEDLLAVLSQRKGWASVTYSAIRNPDDPPQDWIPLWPEQWSRERLIERHGNTTPHNFWRMLVCRILSDETSRFQKAWIDACLALGRGRYLVPRAPIQMSGSPMPCFAGVDLAVGKNEDSDLSCIFTIGIENGTRKIPLDIQTGRWQAPDILQRIRLVIQRYNAIVMVEDNGAQNFLLQWATGEGLPVHAFTTGRNKYDVSFGIESLAVEMRSGLWVIPSGANGTDVDPEIKAWLAELQRFHPDAHTGDRAMASWLARECSRRLGTGFQHKVPTMSR